MNDKIVDFIYLSCQVQQNSKCLGWLMESLPTTESNIAVASGYWPLMLCNPALQTKNKNPFILDTTCPTILLKEFGYKELRYKSLTVSQPKEAEELMTMDKRW